MKKKGNFYIKNQLIVTKLIKNEVAYILQTIKITNNYVNEEEMKKAEVNCLHACKNSCAMLNEALRKETELIRFHEAILEECSYPEIREFIVEITEAKRELVLRIIQKLNEMHARSQIIDGVISSFDENPDIKE